VKTMKANEVICDEVDDMHDDDSCEYNEHDFSWVLLQEYRLRGAESHEDDHE
jgi:hypothetical protein